MRIKIEQNKRFTNLRIAETCGNLGMISAYHGENPPNDVPDILTRNYHLWVSYAKTLPKYENRSGTHIICDICVLSPTNTVNVCMYDYISNTVSNTVKQYQQYLQGHTSSLFSIRGDTCMSHGTLLGWNVKSSDVLGTVVFVPMCIYIYIAYRNYDELW